VSKAETSVLHRKIDEAQKASEKYLKAWGDSEAVILRMAARQDRLFKALRERDLDGLLASDMSILEENEERKAMINAVVKVTSIHNPSRNLNADDHSRRIDGREA